MWLRKSFLGESKETWKKGLIFHIFNFFIFKNVCVSKETNEMKWRIINLRDYSINDKWLISMIHIYFSVVCFNVKSISLLFLPLKSYLGKPSPFCFHFLALKCSIHLKLILTYKSIQVSQVCLLNPSFHYFSFIGCLYTPVLFWTFSFIL